MPTFEINGIDYSAYFAPIAKGVSLDGRRRLREPKRRFNCKSRKRFIKLLMSAHIPRNVARNVADSFPEYDSWQFRFWYFRLIVNEWKRVYRNV